MNVSLNDAWLEFLISPAAKKLAMEHLELEGYLTGVIVSPEMIRPAHWIDPLWRDDPFDDERQAQVAMSGVMARYNGILRELDRSLEQFEAERTRTYRPAFLTGSEKPARDAVRSWMKGFWRALALAPAGWVPLIHEERGRILMAPLVAFFEVDGETALKGSENIDELLDDAAETVPGAVLALRTLSQIRGSRTPSRRDKVGRNDPCPCGSGKKHKKCCGQ